MEGFPGNPGITADCHCFEKSNLEVGFIAYQGNGVDLPHGNSCQVYLGPGRKPGGILQGKLIQGGIKPIEPIGRQDNIGSSTDS